MRLPSIVVCLALPGVVAPALSGQHTRIVSEFQRIRPDGEVVAADRVEHPREILSPAIPRNAYATFRVVVEAPPGMHYTIYIAQNPDDVFVTRFYREEYAQVGQEWIPDRLSLQELPVNEVMGIGQKSQSFLLDVFVPAGLAVARYRIEAQVWLGDHWVILPMEVRVRPATGPGRDTPAGVPAALGDRIDANVTGLFREFLCGDRPKSPQPASGTGRALLQRNVRQDLALARQLESEGPHEAIAGFLMKAAGYASAEAFCGSKGPAPAGPEWWLRARDFLYLGLPVP